MAPVWEDTLGCHTRVMNFICKRWDDGGGSEPRRQPKVAASNGAGQAGLADG